MALSQSPLFLIVQKIMEKARKIRKLFIKI